MAANPWDAYERMRERDERGPAKTREESQRIAKCVRAVDPDPPLAYKTYCPLCDEWLTSRTTECPKCGAQTDLIRRDTP